MHPRTMARERHQSANPSMAGITHPSFTCAVCGERRAVSGGYALAQNRRQRICRTCKPEPEPKSMTAQQIMHKIETCNTPGQQFAVVVRKRVVTMVKVNTDRFKAIERHEPEIIVGVYDVFADEGAIRDDMEAFGVSDA